MLGLDLIGVTAPSRSGGAGSSGDAGSAAADKVASKAQGVAARAGKAKGIAAYAKKAAAAAKNTKGKLASAKARAKKKAPSKKPVPTAHAVSTAAAVARGVSPAAVSRPPTRTLTARGTRMIGDDCCGGGLYLSVQAIDPAILRQAIAEMNSYDTGLDNASQILQLVGQINQLLPAVQAAGLVQLYDQGNALLNEAYNCDPSNAGDLPSRCQAWIAQAQSQGAYPGVGQPQQQAPMDAGGGGDYGDGGGGGGMPMAPAGDDGGGVDDGGDYNPEGDAAEEAAAIEEGDGSLDDDAGLDDGGDDGMWDQPADQQLVGANTGMEAGVDINAANQAVRGAKPLSQALAKKFLSLATKCLQAANMLDTQEGATARRNNLIEKLESMSDTIDAHPNLDPLPEAGAQNSPAEMLRNTVLQAIVEYNATAEGIATLAEARSRLWADFVQSAKDLANKAGDTASSLLNALKWLAIGAGVLVAGGGSYLLYQKGMREYVRS